MLNVLKWAAAKDYIENVDSTFLFKINNINNVTYEKRKQRNYTCAIEHNRSIFSLVFINIGFKSCLKKQMRDFIKQTLSYETLH